MVGVLVEVRKCVAWKVGCRGSIGIKAINMTCGCIVVTSLSCEGYWVCDCFKADALYVIGPFLIYHGGWDWCCIGVSPFE